MTDSQVHEERNSHAYGILLSDLVERLLALSDNPRKASDFIAEELRGIVGARTVIVVSHLETADGHRHLVRSVYPERRRQLAEGAGFMGFVTAAHAMEGARLLKATDPGPEADLLGRLGSANVLILPLAYGSKRVGGIFLLDLMDDESLHKAMETLERLSSILALVLRNADLYANLEDEVADRTAMLERRRLELEALLKEVHHRVKNNLQIILILLYLKSSTTDNDEAKALIQESQDSIFAMSQVHEEIYRTGDFSGIDMAEYIPRVTDRMIAAASPWVVTRYRLDSLRLDLGVAIPCSLIVSELVTNSIKHAFAGRHEGTLTIETSQRDGEAFIRIADDGPGFQDAGAGPRPAGPEKGAARQGVGLDIVNSLVDQIGGRIVREPGPGASVLLLFRPR